MWRHNQSSRIWWRCDSWSHYCCSREAERDECCCSSCFPYSVQDFIPPNGENSHLGWVFPPYSIQSRSFLEACSEVCRLYGSTSCQVQSEWTITYPKNRLSLSHWEYLTEMCLLLTEPQSIHYCGQDLLTILSEVIVDEDKWWRESRLVCSLYLAEEGNHENEEMPSVLSQIGELGSLA